MSESAASPPRQGAFPNVLADRYASAAMVDIWAPEAKVRLERELWLAVLEAQRREAPTLAATATDAALDDYRRVVDHVDLDAIRARERITRHDVKARIEEFNALRRPRAGPRGPDLP